MTVKEIVAAWLKDHGYNGLYNDYNGCGCSLSDDFISCSEVFEDCIPGYRHECPCADCDGECDQDESESRERKNAMVIVAMKKRMKGVIHA